MKEQFTRRELYNLVWSQPMSALAKTYGISDRGLAKLCDREGIPVPPRGYWAKKAAGQKVKRPPLIEIENQNSKTITLSIRSDEEDAEGQVPEANPFMELYNYEMEAIGKIEVPVTLHQPHPVIAKWLEDERRKAEIYRWAQPKYTPLERRKFRLLSTLFKALEARGFSIHQPERYSLTQLRFEFCDIEIALTERIKQYRRPLNAEEQRASLYQNNQWRQIKEPTGELVFKVKYYMPSGFRDTWKDEEDKPLEAQMSEVIVGCILAMANRKHQRQMEYDASERRRKAELERRLEHERQQALHERVNSWKAARVIQEYVGTVHQAVSEGRLSIDHGELGTWMAWALNYAKHLDPIQSGQPLC